MADGEGSNRERRGNRSRKTAPVIEMTAVEVPEVRETTAPAAPQETETVGMSDPVKTAEPPATPEPVVEPVAPSVEAAATETTQAAPQPDVIPPPPLPPPAPPRNGLPMAVAAVLGAVFGAGAGALIPAFTGAPSAIDPARVQRIEQGLAELARRPAAPTPALPAEVQSLPQRLVALENDIKARLSAQDQKLAAAPATPTPGASVDLKPLTDKFGALEAALAALDQKAEAAKATASESLKAVEPQLRQLSARVEATAAAPLYSAVQALTQAFQRGAPFTAEISALEALGVKPEQIAALKAMAARGAPSPQRLAEAFQPMAMDLARAGEPAATGLAALWQNLVKSRPTGSGAGDTPPGLVATIEQALKSGDVGAALGAWTRLPEPARKASEAWAATAREREAAQKALRELNEAAIAALKKASP